MQLEKYQYHWLQNIQYYSYALIQLDMPSYVQCKFNMQPVHNRMYVCLNEFRKVLRQFST